MFVVKLLYGLLFFGFTGSGFLGPLVRRLEEPFGFSLVFACVPWLLGF